MKFSYIANSLAFLLLSITGTNAFAPPATQNLMDRVSTGPNTSTNLYADLEKLAQKTPDDMETRKLLAKYGERSRSTRRNVYSAADWVYARRSDRIVNNIMTTFDSGLVRQLQFEITFLLFSSTFIVAWNDLLAKGWDDFAGVHHDSLVHFLPALQLPLTPFTLSVSALGLLLTFRTNVSYSRWNEARTAWGKIINDSRSIARMGCTWGKSYKNITDDMVQRLGEAILSFSRSVMNRTLPPQEDEENYRQYLLTKMTDQNYAAVLRDAKHRPTAALAEITNVLVDMNLNPLHQVEAEKTVTGLCDALGACERIFTSPVPTFYPRHTSRFLALWLLALPTALYEPFAGTWNHLGMIPSYLVVSGFLLGIEELATQMEEPFSILPMEKMCEGSIRTSVMEQVERSQLGIQAGYKGEDYLGIQLPREAAIQYTDATTVAPEPIYEEPVYEEPVSFNSPGPQADNQSYNSSPPPPSPDMIAEMNAAWSRNSMGRGN